MTHSESEPLLRDSSGGSAASAGSAGKKAKPVSYSAVADTCYVSGDGTTTSALSGRSDSDMQMEPVQWIRATARNESKRGSPEGSAGSGASLLEQQLVTYTWHRLNVFAPTHTSRHRRRFWGSAVGGDQPRKHILKDVSGVARPGELLAILGASGAGKTTLLNALTFRGPAVHSGQRALSGWPANAASLAALSAYVQQDDLFVGTLTVREHLVFQALVRMDRYIPYKQRMQRVDEVIQELALLKCQHTVIGIPGRIKGISGGEMKRLSFASEVLTDPPLMFCDEPTSGLDAYMALTTVAVLKDMARKGKAVVATIHQPSSELFALFDKLLLMAEGRVAFLGTADEALAFFRGMGASCPANYNPADFFVQLLAVVPGREDACRQTVELVCDAFARSEIGQRIEAESEVHGELQFRSAMWKEQPWQGFDNVHSPYKASWCAQFRAVLWRSWLSVIKEPILIRVRLLQTVMVGFLIGLIYFGQKLDQDGVMNINGALFIFLTNMTFQNVLAVINVFCSELPVFSREHLNGMYRTDVYFLSKTLAELPIFIVIPLIFTSVSYYMVGFNPDPQRFAVATLIVILVANVATSFGYLISCISSSVSMALSIGPPVVIPFLLFGGFFLNSASVPSYFEWLSYLSWFKYGNEALLINQWSGVEEISCTRANSTCPSSGHVVLETLNFSEDDFSMDIISLFALIVVFRLLAFLALLARASHTH
ncbi:protein white-like [Schistocerca nitens]|uniref:protein white-like n=1 Tax=Schistocerca nitens TaxID=7011 RepID=UPI002117A4FA|nr:protein white-like [Schistocerca nitens]